MADAIALHDWSSTPLGPREHWSAELRVSLAFVLNLEYPSALYWGSAWTMIYNDALVPHLSRRSSALGQPGAEVWGDRWPYLARQFEAVAQKGIGITEVDQRLELVEEGTLREQFWNYSFTPIHDSTGAVAGVHVGGRETTALVHERQTNALLIALDEKLLAAETNDVMIDATLAVIGKHLGVERTGFGEIDLDSHQLHIRRCWTTAEMPDICGLYPLGSFGRISDELASGKPVLIEDNRTDPRTSEAEIVARYDRIGLRSGIVIPIVDKGRYAGGVFVQSNRPQRWLPHKVALAEAASQRLWNALVRERTDAALRASEQRYRLIFEQAEDIIFTADIDQRITDANTAGAKAIGLPRDALIGHSIADFVDADGFRQTTTMLRHKLDNGGNTRHEVSVVSADGRRMRWENNSTLIVDPDKHPIGLLSISRDVTERRAFDERRELLINELNHRVKNTLALVQAIAHQSFRPAAETATAQDNFLARLRTLAGAHDLLTRDQWEGVTLAELVGAATAVLDASRIDAKGDTLVITPKSAVALAMAFHELGTNAVKYGALSTPDGRVGIEWAVVGDRLRLDWRETGGPVVVAPDQRGFGVKMIERALASDLGGQVSVDFAREGVQCTIDAPRKGNVT